MLGSETSPAPQRSGLSYPSEAVAASHLRTGGFRGVRVGEARCPGPRLRQASGRNPEAKLLVLNCGGAPGAWRLYEENMLGPQVVCLQEVSMSSEEWRSFARALAKKGYSAYYTPGPTSVSRYGHPKYNGGVASLVHRSIALPGGECAT